MEVNGHEVTVNPKSAKNLMASSKAETHGKTDNGRVVACHMWDLNVMFVVLVKVFENGTVMSKQYDKNTFLNADWTVVH